MSTKKIEQWEVERYWEIFSNLADGRQHLNGARAATVLKNSQLRDDQLESIWDLADVDNDGNLDFEEFCVAMRLIFDLVNGEYSDLPSTLPDWLVPESKAHLVQATRALQGQDTKLDDLPRGGEDESGLRDGFDWYMAPADREKYEEIYTANRDGRGEITFDSLFPLYASLDVPDSEVRRGWDMVNPSSASSIGKDATLVFLHMLNNRHEGYRIPRNVPASLRASFERKQIDHRTDHGSSNSASAHRGKNAAEDDQQTSTGRKAKFGDTYLSRLGIGDRGGYRHKGSDFGNVRSTEDWEEVRLKKQLKELNEKISRVEEGAARRQSSKRHDHSKPALVKRELEQLLDYKRRTLTKLQDGASKSNADQGYKGISDDIQVIKEQVEMVEQHLAKRQGDLQDLRRQVTEHRSGR